MDCLLVIPREDAAAFFKATDHWFDDIPVIHKEALGDAREVSRLRSDHGLLLLLTNSLLHIQLN